MRITGKVWGTTALIEATPIFEMHRLDIKPHHECSLHVHRRKANGFMVIKGRLFVDVLKEDYPLTNTTELKAGDHVVVPPGEYHKFRTGREACVAVEWYTPALLSSDIERRGHGGKVIQGRGA